MSYLSPVEMAESEAAITALWKWPLHGLQEANEWRGHLDRYSSMMSIGQREHAIVEAGIIRGHILHHRAWQANIDKLLLPEHMK
jgi:hypothetical protein